MLKASNFAIRQALYELAGKKAQEYVDVRSIVQYLREGHYFGAELYDLARLVAGVDTMKDSEILLTFMEPEARDILMKMPNPHYFWLVLRQSVMTSMVEESVKIGRQEVLDAIAELRSNMGMKYVLRQRLADIPAEGGRREHRIASRAAVGLVLVNSGSFETDTMIDNPVFFETY